MEILISIVKLPRTAKRRLGSALPVEVKMGVAEPRVGMLFVAVASAVLREAIAEQAAITAWLHCVRWVLGNVTRSKSASRVLCLGVTLILVVH